MTTDCNVSIIIPVFNAEKYLAKAVKSSLNQPETKEILLIEDGSSDHSLSICLQLSKEHQKIKLLSHQNNKNCGAGASRNLGIDIAKGEFISFLDADDYFLPNRFKHDLRILQTRSDIDGVYNALGVHIYDEEEQERINFNLTTVKYPIPPENLFEEMSPLGASGYFHGNTLTVRRSIFDKVGPFDTSLELSQDTHMWIKMAAQTTLTSGIINRPVAMRGVHRGNRVKNKIKFNYYRPLLFSSLFKWANKNNIPNSRKKLLWDHLFKFYDKSIHNNKDNIMVRKAKMFMFLVKHGVENPYLITHQNYLFSYFKLAIRP